MFGGSRTATSARDVEARSFAGRKQRQGRFSALPSPLCCCTPTLYEKYEEGSQPPQFESACILALSALGDERWDGCWRLDVAQESRLLRRIASDEGAGPGNRLLPVGGPDGVTKDQIINWSSKEENRTAVMRMPKAIHGLLNLRILNRAFQDFDANHDGQLSTEEFSEFLDCLEGLHIQFLLGQAFADDRSFFARKQPWNTSRALGGKTSANGLQDEDILAMAGNLYQEGAKRIPSTFQLGRDPDGFLPPGYAADLHYYLANNHPLYSIVACDPNNPLSSPERVAMEVATFGFTTFCVAMQPWKERKVGETHGVGVTIAGMALWWVLFLLFTCPRCGRIDLSQPDSGGRAAWRAKCCSGFGAFLGYLLLLPWLGFLGYVIYLKAHHSDKEIAQVSWLTVCKKRFVSYLFSLVLAVIIEFNPLFAWGQPNPLAKPTLGDSIGFGRWRIEKQRFQSCCAELLDSATSRFHYIRGCATCSIS